LRIFVVEDNEVYAKSLAYHLSLNPDNEVEVFHSGKECLDNLHKKPAAITLDYSLPDMSGAEVLKKIKLNDSDIPVVIISGQLDVGVAIGLLKEGAYDYLVKDEDVKDRVWNVVNHIRENISLKNEISRLRNEVSNKYDFSSIKGSSVAIRKVFKLIEKASKTNITVSLTGATGTGKELVAKSIHYNSLQSKGPLVTVNIAAVPSELIESELFGHEKGAFTGAVSRRIGRFEEADGGTILLDEIGEMDANLQAKLLRVLQEREITRIGSNKPIKFNARVIVATHRNLAEEVKKGNFREDLYYRILGLPIEIPPLRERDNDILHLAKFFVDEFSVENGMGKIVLSNEAQKKLKQYNFPGNVRELKAIAELAAVMSDNGVIEADNITFNSSNTISEMMMKETTLRNYNLKIIQHYLEKYNNNILEVAKVLDVGKSTLYRMIKSNELIINP
jgi:DNA-binding NtrC family response regulator